jgi:hypothetical protein
MKIILPRKEVSTEAGAVHTISECASHAVVDAAVGGVAGKGAGEQSPARKLYPRLEEDWLLIADRNFFSWADWCAAADSGAALLWRVKADLTLPVLELLPDRSYSSVLVSPRTTGKARQKLIEAARAGADLGEADITRKKHLNARRHHRTYPRVVKRAPQLLPGETAWRSRHPSRRPGHDQAGQSPPAHTRSMINLG